MNATALIAEDEPLLAAALQAELAQTWPDLRIVAQACDGVAAVQQALACRPDVLFLDIRMPGQSGLEAAAELAEEWPDSGPDAAPFPVLVFVTAYDQYALQAFEAQAVDYLLKPVVPERLARTVQRVQALLATRRPLVAPASRDALRPDDATLQRLRALLAPPPHATLKVIQAHAGTHLRLVPVDEVLVFEAADKYVRVITTAHAAERGGELLIRTPLRELLPRLDASVFWQIHRSTVVRATAIHSVLRDEAGKLHLTLRNHPGRWAVSRLYAPLFKAM
ncbi:LytR/AlgR family response regulator transcription factor [Hydrogenophaga sp. NFH-34]|uniref:LytR/AlgR family response regulator transcription factor n=1 Tax=Hydrogenophaga sp. NFH-34 TaxID=2744446 RepID=UPI001F4674DA|nr:LytTR family DNA-binding domain-containing protein [Hydrogenophaga sp. NFH-34]